MAITHVFSNAIADGTNTNIVRPSDWNRAHAQIVTLSGNTAGVAQVTGTNVVFAGGNNVTLSGIQGANAGTISFNAPSPAGGAVNFSAGTTSSDLGSVVFSNANGVSFGLNGSVITGTVATNYQSQGAYLTTARASTDAIGLNTAKTNVTWTVNSSGISLDAGAYLTTARASNDAIGLNTAKTNVTWTVNSSGISLDAGGYNGTGFTSTTTAGTAIVGTNNTNGLSMGVPAFITTARGSTDAIGLNTAQSNVTWTVNSSGLSLDARGYAGTGTTFAGTNVSASMTHNSVGLNLALSVAAPGGGGANTASWFENFQPQLGGIQTLTSPFSGSTFFIQPFMMPFNISASYIRLLGSANTNSTTFATTANTSFTGSVLGTYGAYVYSQMSGASSGSLGTLASGSAGYTMAHSLTANANGSQYSVSVSITYPTTGNTSSFSTSYAVSQTHFGLSTGSLTDFTAGRYLDIRFANSLPQSNLWLAFGQSWSTATQVSAAQNNFFAVVQAFMENTAIYASTWADFARASNATDAFKPGLGSFSTTVSNPATIIALNGITAGHNRLFYFQMSRRT